MSVRGITVMCPSCRTPWTALELAAIGPCPSCNYEPTQILAIVRDDVAFTSHRLLDVVAERHGAAQPRQNPPRGAKRVKRSKRIRARRNSPRGVRVQSFDRKEGHLVSKEVLELQYFNVGSVGRTPYVHEFESAGVEMWALADGSLLLRHPAHRLWEDFVVPSGE